MVAWPTGQNWASADQFDGFPLSTARPKSRIRALNTGWGPRRFGLAKLASDSGKEDAEFVLRHDAGVPSGGTYATIYIRPICFSGLSLCQCRVDIYVNAWLTVNVPLTKGQLNASGKHDAGGQA